VRIVLNISETCFHLKHTTLHNLALFYQKEGKRKEPNHIALTG